MFNISLPTLRLCLCPRLIMTKLLSDCCLLPTQDNNCKAPLPLSCSFPLIPCLPIPRLPISLLPSLFLSPVSTALSSILSVHTPSDFSSKNTVLVVPLCFFPFKANYLREYSTSYLPISSNPAQSGAHTTLVSYIPLKRPKASGSHST